MYALLFADHGMSAGQISSLFVIWSCVAFLAEVPSGALADRVSRRHLLASGQVLRAAGFGLWVAAPGYAAFAAGFVLWGTGSAFTSGTEQALVYDGLAAIGQSGRYPRLMGLAGTARLLGNAATTALATPLLAVGGYRLAGAVSVAVCLAAAAVALALPQAPRMASPEDDDAGYWATLRAGLREAAGRRPVRRVLFLAALIPGLWGTADEYLPLLAQADHLPLAVVPLVLLPMVLAQAGATALAGRCAGMRPAAVAALLAAGAGALAAGALVRHPAGFLAVAAGMGALGLGNVLVDARLQDAIAGPARATVTSVAGFGAEVVAVLLYAGYGAGGAAGLGVPTLVAAFALPLGLVAAVTPRWLPRHRAQPSAETMAG